MNESKEIPDFTKQFILHWGEMGTKWGINRTVAQIHALLFLQEKPMHAEEICQRLGVARSNVSNSLKELQHWGIIHTVPQEGDRRDHFVAIKDVYEMFRIITAERKKREIDPTLGKLRGYVKEAASRDGEEDAFARQQLEELLGFFELVSDFYDKMNRLPTKSAVQAIRMGDRLTKMLGVLVK